MDMNAMMAMIGATLILVAIPGPNVALIIANTLARGFGIGALTTLGTTVGVGLQLTLVVVGLAVLLEYAAAALGWLKWAGVIYLVWLGILSWRAGASDLDASTASQKPPSTLFARGMIVAALNPKTLVFNAAFLPQFLNANTGIGGLIALSCVFLTVVFFGDLVWALCAQAARVALIRYGRLRHRITGVVLMAAGVALAMARADISR